jgi:hypothetical protein
VPGDSIVDVQVDGSTRVRGRIAASDRAAGVAVVAVALQAVAGLSESSRSAGYAGEGGRFPGRTGIFVHVGRAARRSRAGDDGKSRPALTVTRADAGRPVVSAAPAVVALATLRGGQSTFAMAPAIDAAVRAAKTRVGGDGFTAPSTAVLPAWPSPAYPA